ncbi:hypothetical protein [Polaribacter sp. Hel1_85]|uniref:hypothetical protein n=1 Tax=Polaribacter sp. Hel1_85 TaxID=1250005 RepID=UPI00052CA93D|nr:hypothetical protein [Polaribacter sp. Hel1_85]KGL58710.1 hypothetical protein PHEL85_2976 [Polaribacter sp. Hel1_85]
MDEKLYSFPLFKKAEEIYVLIQKVSLLIEENVDKEDFENNILVDYKNQLNESALIIPAKIVGAYKENTLYDIKMQNAAIIRKEARIILATTSGLKMCGFKELDYLELIRNEVEEFRILFAEWVKTFDEWNYIIDRWGLFNPPGVNYDDYDIDDDLPFNNPFDDEF